MPPQTGQSPVTPPITPSPTTPVGTTMPKVPQGKNQVGPIVGIVIIVLMLILGGLYFWGQRLNQPNEDLYNPQAEAIDQEISAIENDLSASAYDSLDQELEQIETDLNF